MVIKTAGEFSLAFLASLALVGAQSATSEVPLSSRLLKWPEDEQVAWTNAYLDKGMPPNDVFIMLVLNRSASILPVIEAKIEQVLQSQSPSDCFTDKGVDPDRFVQLATLSIAYAGDAQALKAASKLIEMDEKRFGWMVERTLLEARAARNPFVVAYRGFEISDPAVNRRLGEWAEAALSGADKIFRDAGTDFEVKRLRHWLAEAMVDRYTGVPTENQWIGDPLISRLKSSRAESLHDEIIRLSGEVVQGRSKVR